MEKINWQYIIDVVVALYGGYVFVTAVKMKVTGEISTFVATTEELFKCHDKKAFIEEIQGPMMAFGLLTFLFGVGNLVNELLWQNKIVSILTLGMFLALCGVFLIFLRKQRDKHLALS